MKQGRIGLYLNYKYVIVKTRKTREHDQESDRSSLISWKYRSRWYSVYGNVKA